MLTRAVQGLLLVALVSLSASAFAEPRSSAKSGAISPPPPQLATETAGARRTAPARAGKSIEVLWGGTWWPAEVIQSEGRLRKIHYTGWGPEWDEWVEPTRIRSLAPPKPLGTVRMGQRLLVEWHGRWWDGEVIGKHGKLVKVHYTGWGPEWDEWVETTRLRAHTVSQTPARQPRASVTGR